MKGIELSTFKPSPPRSKGGVKVIPHMKGVIPVSGSTAGISEQARIIHAWLLEQYAQRNKPITVLDVINTHGAKRYVQHMQHVVRSLQGFPLEELLDASLLYVAEDAQ